MKRTDVKRVTVYIDVEPMERLQNYLDKAGISMTAFFNSFVKQTVDGLDGLKIPDPSEMTLGEVAAAFGRIAAGPERAKIKKGYIDDLSKKRK
jgi:hypothetical protein